YHATAARTSFTVSTGTTRACGAERFIRIVIALLVPDLLDIWTFHGAPVPRGHRRRFSHLGAQLRVDDREPCAPLEVRDERRAELRLVRDAAFVRAAKEELHPALALLLREVAPDVVANHGRVTAKLRTIRLGPAEHLGDEARHVIHMVGLHPGEERREERVPRD